MYQAVGKKQAETTAREYLHKFGVKKAPVDVMDIARQLDLELLKHPFKEDESGILVVKGDRAIIGYNPDQSPVRQRFSVAHEIGHFLLHYSQVPVSARESYVDVFKRDWVASQGVNKLEIDANAFAAELLMPEHLVKQYAQAYQINGTDLVDDDVIKELADAFEVSIQAISIRLARLRYMQI